MNSKTGCFSEIFTFGPYQNLENFSDATVKSKDGKIYNIHRMILASKSEYFKSMFSFDKNRENFSLENIDSRILEQILVFLYTGQVSLKLKEIPDLLVASDFMLIDQLILECNSFVLKNLDVPHCLPLLDVARRINNKDLFQTCYRFAQLHFQDVIENHANIGSLTVDILKKCLAEKCLNISSEEIIWHTIHSWIIGDLAERLKFVPDMLTYLNIENIDDALASRIMTSSIVDKNEHCKAINELKLHNMPYLNILKNHMLLQGNPIFSLGQARLPPFINFIIYKPCGQNSSAQLLATFDEKLDVYGKICDLDFFPREIVLINNKLILYEYGIDVNSYSWNVVENVRTTVSQTFISRYFEFEFNAATFKGVVYCIAEEPQGRHSNNAVECYNPEVDEWTFVTPMPSMYVDSVISCCDEIYAFGYVIRYPDPDIEGITQMLAQKYTPETDSWSLIALPNIERYGAATAQYNNKILLIGGENHDGEFLYAVDEYDPVTNTWSSKPELPVKYIQPRHTTMGDILYIFDHCESFDQKNREPPVFWHAADQTWQIVPETSPIFKLKNFRFCCIDNPEILKKIVCNRRNQNWVQNSLFN